MKEFHSGKFLLSFDGKLDLYVKRYIFVTVHWQYPAKRVAVNSNNKGKGRGKEKMKKTEGYVVRRLEDEYLVLPSGKRTEEVNEVISLSETAGFIYMHAERAENVDELAQLVAEEYEIEPAEVLEDVRNVVLTLQKKGILL